MSITYYKEEEGIAKLARLLLNENLTPIIGSGFTAGCKTETDTVPDGDKATELMQTLIKSVNNSLDLSNFDFNKTSERFYRFVNIEQRNRFFKQYFTKVSISKDLYNFIDLPWPYIFTLNIDDGIENTGLFKPVLPYKNAIIPKQSNNLIYKIHGDANYEISYNNDGENIVFSSTQYLKFLTSPQNTTIINAIQSDYKQKNILFIGCSLKNEPDLKQIYTNVKDEMPINALRAIIKRKKLSANEEIEIEDYGINTVILVENYHSFYTNFVNEFHRISANEGSDTFPFKNPKINDISNDKEQTLEFFGNKCIFINAENSFYKSGMHIIRSIINKVEKCLTNQSAVIIQGRRFSGKTHLLCELLECFKTFDIYYFPSDIVFDEDIIKNMLNEKKDSIFIFDSNSLSDCAYQVVVHSIDNLKDNNNKIVLAVNSKDLFLSENLNTEIINLSYKFYESNELSSINRSADKYSLIRRKRNDSNIDYLKRIINEQKINLSIGLDLPDKFTLNERIVLFLLCLKDKVYYSEISSMNISFREVGVLLDNMHGIIEKTNVSKGESSHHSAYKLVHNSKYVLLSIMSTFTQDEIVKIITYIISKTSSDSTLKRLGVETVLFDNLNQLFGNIKVQGKLFMLSMISFRVIYTPTWIIGSNDLKVSIDSIQIMKMS